MAYRITFVIDLFKGPEDASLSHEVLQELLMALTRVNVDYLKANPNTPRLYATNGLTHKPRVHYELEPAGQEDWQDIPTTLELGEGDCEDLACWRAAELQVKDGVDAWPMFKANMMPNGGVLYHILVKHPDGSLEDPSKKLGMGGGHDRPRPHPKLPATAGLAHD